MTANKSHSDYSNFSEIPRFLFMPDERPQEYLASTEKTLPFAVTPHFLTVMQDLLNHNKQDDFLALRAQIMPTPCEETIAANELVDPLGEAYHKKENRVIHQYKNRALLLANGRCFAHCRYCFRKNYLTRRESFMSNDEIDQACMYVRKHTEIDEILLSGGDVLFASDQNIKSLILKLRNVRADLLIRICTRSPTFLPERITKSLCSFFKSVKPLWVIPHINHPAELSKATVDCLEKIINAGISVQSQTVLLKNVNDSVPILSKLFTHLTKLGVKPGYLFQCDLAQGIAHFRLPLQEALALYENLICQLSGLSLPVFALDLPSGGGKINLLRLCTENPSLRVTHNAENYIFSNKSGKSWLYPKQ